MSFAIFKWDFGSLSSTISADRIADNLSAVEACLCDPLGGNTRLHAFSTHLLYKHSSTFISCKRDMFVSVDAYLRDAQYSLVPVAFRVGEI